MKGIEFENDSAAISITDDDDDFGVAGWLAKIKRAQCVMVSGVPSVGRVRTLYSARKHTVITTKQTAFQKEAPIPQPCLTDTKIFLLEKNGELREKCFSANSVSLPHGDVIVVVVGGGASVSQRQTRYVYCTAGQWAVRVTLAEAVKA